MTNNTTQMYQSKIFETVQDATEAVPDALGVK